MSDKVRIALDAMGGDHGPAVVVAGAELALQRHPGCEFLFFGNAALIAPLIDARPRLKSASRLVHTDIAVRMEDKPSQALRYGRWKSSMWLAIDAVKKGDADMVVSAGNTGALMAMSKFNLKTLPGIERPAIAALWPTLRGELIVLDVGASIGADAEHLVDLAVMGAATARILFGLPRPTVGLLNIGVEEAKGLEQVREAGRILREENLPDLDYHGFVEGDDIGRGKVDVVVTEGFAGNIALKTAEGTARQIGEYLQGRDEPLVERADRLSVRAVGVPAVARAHGSAPRQWRGVSRPQRHRHQEPRRRRCRRLRGGDRTRPRRGARRTFGQDQRRARPHATRRRSSASSAERPRDSLAFGHARLRQLSAEPGPHQ